MMECGALSPIPWFRSKIRGMAIKLRGVMQSPVTPLKDDFTPDLPTFERLLDFHVRTSGTSISWPHHKGESLNLTIAERKRFAEVAVKTVAKRVPVSVHISALSVEEIGRAHV